MATRAVVLSGGGPLAVAWQAGLLAGFAEGGVDVALADFTLGTSAGAIVGSQAAGGADLSAFVAAIVAEAEGPPAPAFAGANPEAIARLPDLFRQAQDGMGNPAQARAEIGVYALAAPVADEASHLEAFSRRLPLQTWPEREFVCTAIDAADGGFQLIGRDQGADLLTAVAASCSLPGLSPPVTIDGRRYMDGGLRSSTNADLAAGYDVVLVVAFQPNGPAAARMAAKLEQEVSSLQDGGSIVVSVTPDESVLAVLGGDTMDVSRRPDVARAGLAQGRTQAGVLKEVWG